MMFPIKLKQEMHNQLKRGMLAIDEKFLKRDRNYPGGPFNRMRIIILRQPINLSHNFAKHHQQ